MATVILSSQFRGLNRAIAPHLLDGTESPQATDFAMKSEVLGVIGARAGHKRVLTDAGGCTIKGVVPFYFPGAQRGRIYSCSTGTWHAVTTPWPSLATPPGSGITYYSSGFIQFSGGPGLIFTFVNPQDLSNYVSWEFVNPDPGVNPTAWGASGTFDMNINGSFQTVVTNLLAADPGGPLFTVLPKPATGLLTQIRWTPTHGAGNFAKVQFGLIAVAPTTVTLNG